MYQNWIWKQLNWPAFYWDHGKISSDLGKARFSQGKILGVVRLLDQGLTLEAVANILVEDSLTSSAIEGEKLNIEEVRSSVARHLGLPTPQGLSPSRNVDSMVELLIDATQRFHAPLTKERLYAWQASLFPTGYSGLFKIKTGELRGDIPMQVVSGKIGQEKIHFIAPDRANLEQEVDQFLEWFKLPPKNLDGLIRAGLAHLWFVTLHPFEDGNGRIARAITDMALSQDENQPMRFFSLSAQILRERKGYYEILEKTQKGNLDITDWLIWFLQQVENACKNAEQIVFKTLAKARFWLRFQNLLNERQRKVVNRLLDAGPKGFAGGINTRKYMSLTNTSRATAYRELADLVLQGCLVPTGKGGRSSAYEINWNSLF